MYVRAGHVCKQGAKKTEKKTPRKTRRLGGRGWGREAGGGVVYSGSLLTESLLARTHFLPLRLEQRPVSSAISA